MTEHRLPAHLVASGMMRAVEAAGGFAVVQARGERDSGTIMVVSCTRGTGFRAWERMPQADGQRRWTVTRQAESDEDGAFAAWTARRSAQDPDLWVIELDIANPERFIASS